MPEQLWGGETTKAVDNFPVSGERVPVPVVRWLGRLKAAAARANGELGGLDAELAAQIADAGDAVAAGEHDDQFPVDVFQTGSGTSSNMNANEVIANLAGDAAHPNDHVNMGQSSNDVFPSAVHLAALGEVTHDLLPAMEGLQAALAGKAEHFADVVKAGRTHLMDAVPVTLGQEFGGYAAQVRLGIQRVEGTLRRVGQIPLGGTATGTGLNTHPEFAAKVREKLAEDTGLAISEPLDPFEAQGNRDALVELSGALKVYAVSLNKIANDLALMGSGPRAGLAELRLPELQKGSSIMPGKVNPVIPEVVIQVAAQVIGNDAAITVAGSQGQFELNVRVPLIARNLLDSIEAARLRLAAAEREMRRRDRGQRGDDRAPRRGDPGDGDRAQPPHRLRPRRRHRQGGGRVGPLAARGRARAGRRALGARGGARPPPHGPAARVARHEEDAVSLPRKPSRNPARSPERDPAARRVSGGGTPLPASRRLPLQRDEALLGQLEDRVGRALAGVAGVLDAAVGHLVGAEGRHLVDQDAAELERRRRLEAAADVAGEDAGLEAELGVVGQPQRLAEVRVAVDRRHRAEDLLAPDLGLARRAGEQGRGEAAALVDQLAAAQQLGAAGDRLVDPLLDPVAVAG